MAGDGMLCVEYVVVLIGVDPKMDHGQVHWVDIDVVVSIIFC